MDVPVAKSITEIAHSLVGGDRQSSYGHPLDNFCCIAVIWSAILKVKVTYKEVALCLAGGVKIGREINQQKQDNLIDGCGYLECLDMCYAEEKRRLAEGWTFEPLTGVWAQPVFNTRQAIEDFKFPAPVVPYAPYPYTPFDPVSPFPYVGDPNPIVSPTIICQKEVNNG